MHIFSHCTVWKNVFSHICDQFQLTPPSQSDTLDMFIDNWTDTQSTIPFHTMWAIQKARNLYIFEGKKLSALSILHQISYSLQLYCSLAIKVKNIRVIGPFPSMVYPYGFFDGAFANKVGGVGYCLYLNESHSFEFALGVGYSTNTKA